MKTTAFCAIVTCIVSCLCVPTMAEVRWCRPTLYDPAIAPDGWVQFDDSTQSCVECSRSSVTLLSLSKAAKSECCGGVLRTKGSCSPASGADNSTTCAAGIKCDGVNQCPDGSDELGCRDCQNTSQFSCLHHADSKPCISQQKVCDGQKDCALGLDETGCSWHRGWCDGFRCGKPHERCIPKSQVCDGTKQCLDGSDESNCRYCLMQFRCSVYQRTDVAPEVLLARAGANTTTAQCIGNFRVCDGIRDCNNSLDEQNCYRWMEWAGWSTCYPPYVCTRTRVRTCVNKFGSEVFPASCRHVEDYEHPNGDPGRETETEVCPPCLPTTSVAPEMSPTTVESTPSETTLGEFTTRVISTLSTLLQYTSTITTPLVGETTQTETSQPQTTTTSEMVTSQPVTSQPITSQPITSQPITSQPITSYPATSQSAATSTSFDSETSSAGATTSTVPQSTYDVATTSVEYVTSDVVTSDVVTSDPSTKTSPGLTTAAAVSVTTQTIKNATEKLGSTPFPFTTSNVNLTGNSTHWGNVTDPGPAPRKPRVAVISLTLIIALAVVAALILLAVILTMVFCCSERRRKTGKWVPRRKYRERQPVSVPQMYHDVSLDDIRVANEAGKEQASSITSSPNSHTLKSLPGVTTSGVDSGIDEAQSTTSSLDNNNRGQRADSGSSRDSPTLSSSCSESTRLENRSQPVRSPSDLPPPPPHLQHNGLI